MGWLVCFKRVPSRSVTPHSQKQCSRYRICSVCELTFPSPPESPPSDSSVNYRNPASPRPRQHRFSHQQGSNPDSTVSSMPARGAGRLRSVPFSTSRPRPHGTQRPAFFSLSTSIYRPPDIPCPDHQKPEPLASRGGVAETVVSLPLLSFSNVSLHCGETPPPAPHPIHPSVRERRRRRTIGWTRVWNGRRRGISRTHWRPRASCCPSDGGRRLTRGGKTLTYTTEPLPL